MTQPELTLLIPTFNEGDIITSALEKIAKALGPLTKATDLIIVDDGTDDLPAVVDRYRLKSPYLSVSVIRSNPPVGKGNSLAKGFAKAHSPIAGFLDVDLSTPPEYIHEAVEAIRSGHTDAFIGSRKVEGALVTRDQFFLKDILGNILGVIARRIIFYGMRNYKDTQCGFKFYRSELAKVLYQDLVAPDGLNDLEILIKANLMGIRVQEKGVVWTDIRESKRSLRRILFGEIKAVLKILWKYRLNSKPLARINVEKPL